MHTGLEGKMRKGSVGRETEEKKSRVRNLPLFLSIRAVSHNPVGTCSKLSRINAGVVGTSNLVPLTIQEKEQMVGTEVLACESDKAVIIKHQ